MSSTYDDAVIWLHSIARCEGHALWIPALNTLLLLEGATDFQESCVVDNVREFLRDIRQFSLTHRDYSDVLTKKLNEVLCQTLDS